MIGNNTIKRTPLLPDRHPIQDFFICDVTDAIPKDDMGSMEHPIYSLSTKPDLSIREYGWCPRVAEWGKPLVWLALSARAGPIRRAPQGGVAMPEDLSRFCCLNEHCPDFGMRG